MPPRHRAPFCGSLAGRDATIVLNSLPFVYIFLSAPLLRPAREEPGVVRVPGGRAILWLVAGFAVPGFWVRWRTRRTT